MRTSIMVRTKFHTANGSGVKRWVSVVMTKNVRQMNNFPLPGAVTDDINIPHHKRAARQLHDKGLAMPANELLRPTFIVSDMDAAVDFYCSVFDWKIIFDQVIKVDRRFPPAAPHNARCRLTVFQIEDPELGTLGFMQYLDDVIPEGPSKHREKLSQGEAILVIRSSDVDGCYERIKSTSAVIVGPPTDWEVVGERPGEVIKLKTMSGFDPNGIYFEVNARDKDSEWPTPAT